MNSFEAAYARRANLGAVIGLLLHVPIQIGAALAFGTSVPVAALFSIFFAAGPLVLHLAMPARSLPTAIAIGVAAMGNSALLIHLGRGMIEMHFHVFVALALLVALARPSAVLAAAVTIALHHVLFWLYLPASVFNYAAGFGIVALHATFVVAETVVLVVVARMFGRTIALQGRIGDVVGRIAGEVVDRSASLRSAGEQYATSAATQASTLAGTSTAIEKIKDSTARNASSAQTALTLADDTRSATESGTREMEGMVAAMTEIKASSDNIAKILKTIDEIAFQTNILALNAAVEAARAGDAGAGFAVVADEVRGLAQRAAQAARETAERIEDSIGKSARGAEISGRVADQLRQIADKTRHVNDLVKQIAAASQDQSRVLVEVSAGMASIDRDTKANAEGAKQTAIAAIEMHGAANTLLDSVGDLMKYVGKSANETEVQPAVPARGRATARQPEPVFVSG